MLAGPTVWLLLALIGSPVYFLRQPLIVYIMPVLLYPIIEEWVFRGSLQPAIASKFPSQIACLPISVANLVTSLLFAGLHFLSHPPIWAVLVFFPSLIFGWAIERYKTLAAPILLHIFYNAGYFLLFS